MRRYLSPLLVALLALLAAPVAAQPETDPPEDAEETQETGEESELDPELDPELEEEEELEAEDPQLRPPQLEMPDVDVAGGGVEEEPEGEGDEWDEEEDEGDDASLLQQAEPPSADPTRARWTPPQTVVSLNGYFRVRGELWDNFYLNRTDLPFNLFRPAATGATPAGSCGGSAVTEISEASPCRGDRIRFANMRLRLEPTISLSDDVQVHMMIDAFDNLVLGSTPDGLVYAPPGAAAPGSSEDQFSRQERTPGVPIDSFTATQNPPQALRNSARDSIYVRRAWAQVTNRGLGQLRFGRMGSHWGLGMLANDGRGIDQDFSSDVDRLMGITKIAGFYLVAAYDFAAQGIQRDLITDLRSVPFDATPQDDVRQFVFAVARREEPEAMKATLQRGGWVLNGGFYFVYRNQQLTSSGVTNAFPSRAGDDSAFVRRNARAFIPDMWLQFQWGGLRLETEAALITGSIENIQNGSFVDDDFRILQFGWAFEGEYRLLEDKLAIRVDAGYASGDADVDGLSAAQGLLAQQTDDRRISHFQFHPAYRIDLILWRNIMGRVAGTWYVKPGISYDLIRNPFGQLFGARVDVVYSHAAQAVQTYGGDAPLGLELDLTLYYRSEDGPDMLDGFYLMAQYGVLFPFSGLGYRSYMGVEEPHEQDLARAQALRVVLGVQY